jgi:hypothetical protein
MMAEAALKGLFTIRRKLEYDEQDIDNQATPLANWTQTTAAAAAVAAATMHLAPK